MVFKAAVCPNCAGELQLPDDKDTVKCMYCGSNIVVRQAIEKASGVNIKNLMTLAKSAEESNNNELAYKYYLQVLEVDINNVDAWIGRGLSAAMLGDVKNPGVQELLSCMKTALDHSPEHKKEYYTSQIVNKLYYFANVCRDMGEYFLNKNSAYFSEFKKINDEISENELKSYNNSIQVLEYALTLDPKNKTSLQAIITSFYRPITICKVLGDSIRNSL